jgi:hypothetical protein
MAVIKLFDLDQGRLGHRLTHRSQRRSHFAHANHPAAAIVEAKRLAVPTGTI